LRPMELFLLCMIIITLIEYSIRWSKRILIFLAGSSSCVGFLQWQTEGYRWQMLPAYVTAAVLLLLTVTALFKRTPKKVHRSRRQIILQVISIILLLVVLFILPALLPVFGTLSPSGEYKVGTSTFHWIDETRTETLTENPTDYRELMVQLWYPVNESKWKIARQAPYFPREDGFLRELSKSSGIPVPLLDYLNLIGTHAGENIPVSNKERSYPLILFSHGFPGSRSFYTYITEELASQGYIVVAIDHPYHSLAVAYPDGRTACLKPLPSIANLSEWDRFIDEIWVKDTQFVLNQIEQLNMFDAQHSFTGKIDLSRIGMLGHSFGGANAAQSLMRDNRIKAAINMDGTLFGSGYKENSSEKPFLLMTAGERIEEVELEGTEPSIEELQAQGITREEFALFAEEISRRKKHALSNNGEELFFPEAQHLSFSDFYLISPYLAWSSKAGDVKRLHREIRVAVVFFFDKKLRTIYEN